ncbi:MAG: hypothetical protein ACYDAN_05535 [Candidatus Limnocylindrales bacterium]
MITNAHHLAAPLVAAAALVLLVIVVVGAARHRPVRFAADRAILLALALVGLGIVSGLIVLLTGGAPSDPLHFVYAVVALAVLPVVRFWDRLARRRALALAVGAVVLAALMLRLFQTG